MNDELVIVARFNDLTQAQGARATLEAAGIVTALRDENTGSIDWGLMPALGGLRLQVRRADEARAVELLGSPPPVTGLPDDPEEVEHRESARRRKRLVGLVSFLIILLPGLIALLLRWLS